MKHQNRVYAYILTLVPHGADAEDIMQETASVAWEKFESFREGTNFPAWIQKIAYYKILDYRKKGGTQRTIFNDDLLDLLAQEAHQAFEQTEPRLDALRSCLGRLSSADRRLLKQRYEEGHTIKSIAEQAQRSVQGLYKVMIRIHDQLRRCVHYSLLSNEVME